MKRLVLLLILIFSISNANAQSISTGGTTRTRDSALLWSCGLKAIAATLTQCIAAAAASTRYYITDIVVVTTTATSGTYAIQYGTGTNCATGTTALFPSTATGDRFNAPVTGAPQHFSFITPLVTGSATAICLIGVATNTITVQMNGFKAP